MMTTVSSLDAHSSIRTRNAAQAMHLSETDTGITKPIVKQASEFFAANQRTIYESTDRMFAVLMSIQWVAAIGAALWITPRAWIGTFSQTHINVLAALFLGGAIILFPLIFAFVLPLQPGTHHLIPT